jgi:hypothetical protein
MKPKLVGASLGLQFAFEAISRGATVSEPIGDNAPYDFIVEKNGTMFRVQVKSCAPHTQKGGYLVPTSRRVPVATAAGKLSSKCVPYNKGDFEALVTLAEDSWYLFDDSILGKNAIYLNPTSSRAATATAFKDNWKLIGL